MSVTCSVCGTINPEGTQYCEGCGVELDTESAGPSNQAQPTQSPSIPSPEPAEEFLPEHPTAEVASQPVQADDAASVPANDNTEAANDVVREPFEDATAASPTTAAPAPARLIIKRYGNVTNDSIPLQGERMIVGRFDPSTGPVDIDVTGMAGAEHISRRHAEVYADSGVWQVRDLGSTNGVFIKRAGASSYSPRLQEPGELQDGDEVAFGNVVFVFRQG